MFRKGILRLVNGGFYTLKHDPSIFGEWQLPALNVKMCMPQHRSLWGLCRRSLRLAPMSGYDLGLLPPNKKCNTVFATP
jgi:hypothetical protein